MTAEAVPTAVRYLAELFHEALAPVKFPDVDAESLSAAVARVDAMVADVGRAEEELARARQAADAGRDELLRLAARAHAYARVYAEDDEGLRARLDAISLPRARPRPSSTPPLEAAPAPAPRRKKKAAESEEAPLFSEPPPEAEPVAAE